MRRLQRRWLGYVLLLGLVPMSSAGQAQQPAVTRAETASNPGCEISGHLAVPLGTELFPSRTSPRAFARFTGRPLTVTASDWGGQRVSVRTGDGSDGVRTSAFVEQAALAVSTRRAVPIMAPHLSIAAGERVEMLSGGAADVRVRKTLREPVQAELEAWTSCAALGLGSYATVRQPILQRASALVSRVPELTVYAEPTSGAREVLKLKTSPRFVLWAVQDYGQFVRVRYSGAILLDAWARAAELEQISEARVYSMLMNPGPATPAAQLELPIPDGARRIVTTGAVPLRVQRDGPVIAHFEPGTSVLVLSFAHGWASVLPERLELAPLEGQQFWASRRDLGL